MDNNPVSGVAVQLRVDAHESETGMSIERFADGVTNANGYVSLTCYIDYYDYPQLDCIRAYVTEPGYTHATATATGVYSTTSRTIYPDIWIMPAQSDADLDGVPDQWENDIIQKFKPILHKHSEDLSQGLANFEQLLINSKFKLKVYNDNGQELYNQRVGGSEECLHKWDVWHWDTYGTGSQSQGVYSLDLDNDQRYLSAPTGSRPIYGHVYKNSDYYYVQYWYYFGMNDIREQTEGFLELYHESDWEHVSIRLVRNGADFVPDKINYYIHGGGKSYLPSECWWSSSNSCTYSLIDQGYYESRTHLHIWLAANGHASYNRDSEVMHTRAHLGLELVADYTDLVDYSPASYNLYFPYDIIINLGEVTQSVSSQCPVSGYYLGSHTYPLGNSKHWLAFRGTLGYFCHSPAPCMPAREAGLTHEWMFFSTQSTFGNGSFDYIIADKVVQWIADTSRGD
ncbi:hypothetical protein KAR48_17810 [bacterium]|nr:hypothetical protein [bacterium]